jgi:hypothetical protein
MNLVETIKGQLGGEWTERIAGAIGVSPEKAQSAAHAAIPTILAGISHMASTPEGARQLDAAVDAAGHETTGAASAAAEQGSGMLQSLLGGNTISGLGDAIGRFCGINGGKAASLLGSVAPMVLGTLKGQKERLGLDAGGLSNFLASQKQNIMSAIPSGLAGAMGSIPGLSGLTNWAKGAAASVGSAGDAAYEKGRDALAGAGAGARSAASSTRAAFADVGRSASDRAPSAARWLVPLIVLLALGAGAWWWFHRAPSNDTTTATGNAAPAPRAPATAPSTNPSMMSDAAQLASGTLESAGNSISNVTTRLTDTMKSATDTLGQVKDPASADAAMPKLKELSTKLDSVRKLTDNLPAAAKTKLTTALADSRSTFNAAVDKVMAIPGVGEKLKPVIDELKAKLDAFAGTGTGSPAGTGTGTGTGAGTGG